MAGKTIGIISLKGGVGKTSVVANLGDAIASFDKRVLLVDGNLSAPNLGLHLNVIEPKRTLHHVLARESRPKEAIYNLDNLDLLPSSIFGKIKASPLKLRNSLAPLKRSYDVILLDSSPALNDETLGVMMASDQLLVVTTPDHPTLSNTLKAVKLAKQRGTPIIGLVLNKVHNKNFELSISDLEAMTEVPVMAVIPYDLDFFRSLAELRPLTSYKPRSAIAEEYKKLAATLIGEKYRTMPFRKLLFWNNPGRQDINRALYYNQVFR
jgi:septum site-determining protein MinD